MLCFPWAWLCFICVSFEFTVCSYGFTLCLRCYRSHDELKMVSNQHIVNTKKFWTHASTNLLGTATLERCYVHSVHYSYITFIRRVIGPWASYQIRKIAGCACAGNAGNVFPRRRFQRKPLVSDPDMHHGTCVTHVPWCMSGSLTCGNGENVPGIPGACAPGILRIWQEAHAKTPWNYSLTQNSTLNPDEIVTGLPVTISIRLAVPCTKKSTIVCSRSSVTNRVAGNWYWCLGIMCRKREKYF